MFALITKLFPAIFYLKSVSDELNYASIHRWNGNFKFLTGIKSIGCRYTHPFKCMVRNYNLHSRLIVREVCCNEKSVVFVITKKDEMAVLVETV